MTFKTSMWAMAALLATGCASASPAASQLSSTETPNPASTPGVAPATETPVATATPSAAARTFETGMIAFGSERDGNGEIYVAYPDGSLVNLTQNAAEDSQPSWSPNGTRIAFVSDRDGNFELYAMNADGSSMTRLVP